MKLKIVVFLSLPTMFLAFTSHAEMTAEMTLINKIELAQQQLNKTQHRISDERLQMNKSIEALQQDVLVLQQKTVIARRLADEKTLSLSQLEKRLESWRQQNLYQRNLINRYLMTENNPIQTNSLTINKKIDLLMLSTDKLATKLYPTWVNNDVVMTNSVIENLPTLSVGPVTWFYQAEQNLMGLASYSKDEKKSGQHINIPLRAELMLSRSDSEALDRLQPSIDNNQSSGMITFDPTLNRALAREQQSESTVEHVAKGGIWAIPIMLFALFAVIIALLKSIQLLRLPKITSFSAANLTILLTPHNNDLATHTIKPSIAYSIKGMQKNLLDIALFQQASNVRDDQLFMQLQSQKQNLDKWISAIALTASISPLLGLLGTVSGMIETFKMMTIFGSGDPEVVSGGIAQALVTTELGLVVAIPALILNAVLSRKAKSYYTELENFAVLLSQAPFTKNLSPQTLNTEQAVDLHGDKLPGNNLPSDDLTSDNTVIKNNHFFEESGVRA